MIDLKTLAVRIGLPATATEDQFVARLDAGQGAMGKLGAILKALGVEDVDGASSRIAGLMKQASDLEAAMPELASLRKAKEENEEAAEEEDVKEAMKAHALPPNTHAALKLLRHGNPAEFAKQFPKTAASHATLTRRISGTNTAGAASPLANLSMRPDGTVGFGARPTATGAPVLGGAVNLSAVAGRNLTEKAMNFLRAQPGGDKLPFDDLHAQACAIVRASAQ